MNKFKEIVFEETTSVNLKIKRVHPDAVLPKQATAGSAGMDLTAVSKVETENYIEYDTGLIFEVPDMYVGLLFPRSSVTNYSLILANSVGVLDSDYRGSVKFRFKKINNGTKQYDVGDRIGQIIILPYPKIKILEVENVDETTRNSGGWGSTGK